MAGADITGSDLEAETSGLPSGPGPFGQWLRDTRLNKNLTVEELSQKSNVSMPAIYNIEAGRTQNPIQSTKDKLSKALGDAVPQDVINKEAEDTSIEGLGSLQGFDPYTLDSIPASMSGVYVFYDISDRPVYVGRAKNIKNRVKQHSDRFWFKRPIVDNAALIRIDDAKLRNQVEEVLIRFLKSNAVINQNLVDRNLDDSEA